MGEPAGIWLRVSRSGQDEESQRPECIRWCNERKYDYSDATTYVIHGRSAFKGSRKFDAIWTRVISDIHQGKIKVLVVWKQNRLDRKLQTFQMIAQVVAAGGRVEFVSQPHLNDLSTMGGRIALKIEEEIAYAESAGKSDNVILKQNALRASGSLVGGKLFGYDIVTLADGRKILKPNRDGKRYIPGIFRRAIAGDSRLKIVAWLETQGAGGKTWHEQTVGRIIANPTYYGKRPNSGSLEVTPLVKYSIWVRANAALNSRVAPGRGATKHDKVLAIPICGECHERPREGCADGLSPMYRIFCGTGKWQTPYMRCSGHGAQRKGCGAPMIPMADFEDNVLTAMLDDPNPYKARVFIPGDDNSEQIGKLRQAAMNAYIKDDRAEFERLDAETKALEDEVTIVPHWDELYSCEVCGPVKDEAPCIVQGHHLATRGEHFDSLNFDERREELRQYWLIIAKKSGVLVSPRNWPEVES